MARAAWFEVTSLRWAVLSSALLLGLRWTLAHRVGFGDAEALYVAYSVHPQPAYLDHPGLVGALARLIGRDGVPKPEAVHECTAIVSTLLPWFGVLAARCAGAPLPSAILSFYALAFLPELVIGSFALTPDLLLAYLWIGALGSASLMFRSATGSARALVAALFTGVSVGLACASKASGVLLGVALITASIARPARAHWRTAAPWLAIAVATVFFAPVIFWEVRHGFPLMRHRFVATQSQAGISLRNVGALLGGQLLYVTPPFLLAAYLVLRSLWRQRDDSTSSLYLAACIVPAAALIALCLWSRVAEAHWLGPAYLSLALGVAHAPVVGRKLALACVGTGAAVALLGFVWVATPAPMKLLGNGYVARYDLSNDLYAWGPGRDFLRDAAEKVREQTGREPVVVGPHYIVCAQAHIALDPRIIVGCRTPAGDDFEQWYPAQMWNRKSTLLFVSDDRFAIDAAREFPDRSVVATQHLSVIRGGRIVRTIEITRLDRTEDVALAPHAR